jgi:hypothetical protein
MGRREEGVRGQHCVETAREDDRGERGGWGNEKRASRSAL